MSTLNHESLLETCFEEVCEEFATSNLLTPEMLDELLSVSNHKKSILNL